MFAAASTSATPPSASAATGTETRCRTPVVICRTTSTADMPSVARPISPVRSTTSRPAPRRSTHACSAANIPQLPLLAIPAISAAR